MKCPACKHDLIQKNIENIVFDVCDNGCGGIWFDLFELQKVDEKHEALGEPLLDVKKNPNVQVDPTQRRNCPRCADVVMMRHFASIKREIELDECPKCGGFWLDANELRQIREQFNTQAERSDAAKKVFTDIAAEGFADMHAESKEKMERNKKIARMLRFACPSYYIPGKQKWGAF